MSMQLVLRWLRKAEENLAAAKALASHKLYATSCFHAQQAAELALKALAIRDRGIQPLTHSLTELASYVGDRSRLGLPSPEDMRWLQEHYLQARYPSARLGDYSEEEAKRAIAISSSIVRRVRELVERGEA